jgi:hypothetical protein
MYGRTTCFGADLAHHGQDAVRALRVLALEGSSISDSQVADRDVRGSPSTGLHATVDPVFTSVGKLVGRVTRSTGVIAHSEQNVVGDLVDGGSLTGGSAGAGGSRCGGRRRRVLLGGR